MTTTTTSTLHDAVIRGDSEGLSQFLELNQGCINERDNSSWPPIFYAVLNNDLDSFKTLLMFGADATIQSIDKLISRLVAMTGGMNILHIAARHGSDRIFRALCSGELNKHISSQTLTMLMLQENHDGFTPWDICRIYGKQSVADLIQLISKPEFEKGYLTLPSIREYEDSMLHRIRQQVPVPKKRKILDGNQFHAFLELIQTLESAADRDNLKTWCQEHDLTQPFRDDVKSQENAKSFGQPLYVAIVSDSAIAVSLLLQNGADPNLASSGDYPLLHCCRNGFVNCLRELLQHTTIQFDVVTTDNRTIIGQNVAVYTEGQESGLHLAVKAVHTEIIDMLSQKPVVMAALIGKNDSFGLTPIDHAMEQIALHDAGAEKAKSDEKRAKQHADKRERLIAMIDRLRAAVDTLSDSALSSMLAEKFAARDAETVAADKKARHKALVARILAEEARVTLESARETQERVAALYPRRPSHLQVYTKSFIATATESALLLPPPPAMQQSSAVAVAVVAAPAAESSLEGSAWPTVSPTVSPIHAALGSAPGPEALLSLYEEPIPGVVKFPLLSAEFCNLLWEEMTHYEEYAKAHPELKLPLDVRHDGNWGNLQNCGFGSLLGAVEEIIQPLVQAKFPHLGRVRCYHSFLTRNWVERQIGESAATFKTHRDKSKLTINVCVQHTSDVVGSTVSFFTPPEDQASFSCAQVPTDECITYRHSHALGHALIHDGRQWHRTEPIERGRRASIIIWAEPVDS